MSPFVSFQQNIYGKYCFFSCKQGFVYILCKYKDCKKKWFNGLSKLYCLVCEVSHDILNLIHPDSSRVLPKGFTIAVALLTT